MKPFVKKRLRDQYGHIEYIKRKADFPLSSEPKELPVPQFIQDDIEEEQVHSPLGTAKSARKESKCAGFHCRSFEDK